jgi:hypothetical protein
MIVPGHGVMTVRVLASQLVANIAVIYRVTEGPFMKYVVTQVSQER